MRILLRSSEIVLFWPSSTPRDREGSYEASYCPATGVDRLLSNTTSRTAYAGLSVAILTHKRLRRAS